MVVVAVVVVVVLWERVMFRLGPDCCWTASSSGRVVLPREGSVSLRCIVGLDWVVFCIER